MSDITWLWPWAWVLLPMPLAVHYLLPKQGSEGGDALLVPDLSPYKKLSDDNKLAAGGSVSLILLALCWIALTTSLARPQSIGEPLSVPLSGRDLLLCIDISGSMSETDLYNGGTPVSRIAVVKTVARDFIERRSADRIGLVLFGSQAYVQTPITTDHETVINFLEEATIGLAGKNTAIGDALGLGVKRLRDRDQESRVLILLTDGANSAGVVSPIEAARLAAQEGIRIYTVGIGTDRQMRNVFGMAVSSRRSELDEASLKAIAEASGGRYFRARNQQELRGIYQEIDRLEPSETQTDDFRRVTELFFWPLSLALLLFAAWMVRRA